MGIFLTHWIFLSGDYFFWTSGKFSNSWFIFDQQQIFRLNEFFGTSRFISYSGGIFRLMKIIWFAGNFSNGENFFKRTIFLACLHFFYSFLSSVILFDSLDFLFTFFYHINIFYIFWVSWILLTCRVFSTWGFLSWRIFLTEFVSKKSKHENFYQRFFRIETNVTFL